MTNSTDSPSYTTQPARPTLSDGGATVSLSTTIVRHVAAEKNVAPSSLRPLYEVIDPEALDLLFDPLTDGTLRASGRVIFEYSGCQVIVTETGDVQATLLESS